MVIALNFHLKKTADFVDGGAARVLIKKTKSTGGGHGIVHYPERNPCPREDLPLQIYDIRLQRDGLETDKSGYLAVAPRIIVLEFTAARRVSSIYRAVRQSRNDVIALDPIPRCIHRNTTTRTLFFSLSMSEAYLISL